MRNKYFASIKKHIVWLMKEYHKAKHESHKLTAYRLESIHHIANSKNEVIVQLIGKNITFKITPEKLLADDSLTELFSPKDIRTITYYACQHMNKPKRKIILKRFCEKHNQIIFGISHIDRSEVDEKTAQEISLSNEIIKSLSSEEAHLVGFTAANENVPKVEYQKIQLRKIRDEQKK